MQPVRVKEKGGVRATVEAKSVIVFLFNCFDMVFSRLLMALATFHDTRVLPLAVAITLALTLGQ